MALGNILLFTMVEITAFCSIFNGGEVSHLDSFEEFANDTKFIYSSLIEAEERSF
jgi:hypothetical protein